MKKKSIAILLTLTLVMATWVFAAEEEPEQELSEQTVTEETGIVPVHGYLGTDATVIVPEPEESATEIYVEMPMRLLFAAFERDGGVVSSPTYVITNLSAANDVRVELESFVQRNEAEVPLEGQLSLKLVTEEGEDLVTGLFPSEGLLNEALAERLARQGEETEDSQLLFMVGGTWDGPLDRELQPVFDMTLRFTGVE